jgi:hypothetical protein
MRDGAAAFFTLLAPSVIPSYPRLYPGRFQMSIFEERNAVFTLLVVINQGHASLAEDAHPSFFK